MESRSSSAESAPASPLVLELLAWIASAARTYDETMEAWRTSCPRQSVWEDAWMNGFVEIAGSEDGMRHSTVTLTALGRKVLEKKSRPPEQVVTGTRI